MKVKLLLVADVEVQDELDPKSAALLRVRRLTESLDIEFYPPAIGRTVDIEGSKSVEVFY